MADGELGEFLVFGVCGGGAVGVGFEARGGVFAFFGAEKFAVVRCVWQEKEDEYAVEDCYDSFDEL